ncbi:MAG: HD domain-containing protein, partial [Chitinivibrionales bacterium]|nr:HD domain-containing protein [Chitinivibrionales bacterium]MBD3356154.1 HD domain-containing protein [Chitinivibrionales bacterium]
VSQVLRRYDIDAIIANMEMVERAGEDVTSLIQKKRGAGVILLGEENDEVSVERLSEAGAADYVKKPVRIEELLVRVERLLRERELRAQRDRALHKLHEVRIELRDAYLDSINRLVLASEYRDDNTGDHIVRMGRSSALLAEKLGMSKAYVRMLRYAAPMHDVGKMGIPDRILLKPRRLTLSEQETMKSHTLIGARLLAHSKSDIIQLGQHIALTHHENWDGSGYPCGIEGERIPITGRIVRLVDVFDALMSSRPYKDAYPLDVALKIMAKGRGTCFDPEITDVFLENVEALVRIKAEAAVEQHTPPRTFAFSQRDHDENPDISHVP